MHNSYLLRWFLFQTIVTGAGDETLRFWNVFPSPKSQVKDSIDDDHFWWKFNDETIVLNPNHILSRISVPFAFTKTFSSSCPLSLSLCYLYLSTEFQGEIWLPLDTPIAEHWKWNWSIMSRQNHHQVTSCWTFDTNSTSFKDFSYRSRMGTVWWHVISLMTW